jgi:hypothetical protein
MLSGGEPVEGLEGVSQSAIEAHELTVGEAATAISVLEIATSTAGTDDATSNALSAE